MAKKKRATLIQQLDASELFVETDFLKDAKIDIDHIDQEATDHPQLYYRYGKLHAFGRKAYAEASLKLDLAKREIKAAQSAAHERIRNERLATGEKVTESLLENESLQSEEYKVAIRNYREASEEQIQAEFENILLEVGEKVFSKRSDLLVALAYLLQREIGSGIAVSRTSAARDAAEGFNDDLKRKVEEAKEAVRKARELQ